MQIDEHPLVEAFSGRIADSTRLLAAVMGLSLVDGIFVAVVLAGGLSSIVGIIEIGVLIFGGSATVAILLGHDESIREQVVSILLIGVVIIPIAAVQSVLAVLVESALNLEIFRRFAGLVIIAIAAKIASAKISDYIPKPSVIILFGLVASLELSGFTVDFTADTGLFLRGAAAASVGILFALLIAVTAPYLRENVDVDRFRFGSAVALAMLALPILGISDPNLPIALLILGVSAILAYSPPPEKEDGGRKIESNEEESPESDTTETQRQPWM